MPAPPPDITVCSHCGIEIHLGTVCPKCHRKGTQHSSESLRVAKGGPRRRASSGSQPAARGRAALRFVFPAASLLALVGTGVGLWLLFGPKGGREDTPSKRPKHKSMAPAETRVFGAQPPPAPPRPRPAPKICGKAYRTSLSFAFATEAAPAKSKPKTAPQKKPAPNKPSAMAHRLEFLIVQGRRFVPLSYRVMLTLGKKQVPALSIDRKGAILPDPKQRRLIRRGFHDAIGPGGPKVSELIARNLAELAPDPAGGLKVTRVAKRHPLVGSMLALGVALPRFLLPRPPKPGARRFTDERLPPKGLLAKLPALLRQFQLETKGKGKARKAPPPTAALRRYLITLPRKHPKGAPPLKGQLSVAGLERLPRDATLTLGPVPGPDKRPATVTIRFESLGRRCSR